MHVPARRATVRVGWARGEGVRTSCAMKAGLTSQATAPFWQSLAQCNYCCPQPSQMVKAHGIVLPAAYALPPLRVVRPEGIGVPQHCVANVIALHTACRPMQRAQSCSLPCVQSLHHGVYLGFRKERRLPTKFGLRVRVAWAWQVCAKEGEALAALYMAAIARLRCR